MFHVPFILIRDAVELRIDREGAWWNDGARIVHPATLRLLGDRLERNAETDAYFIPGRGAPLPVRVEEWPFVAEGARVWNDSIVLRLSDGSEETIRPFSLNIDEKNRLLFPVKSGKHIAAASRQASQTLMAGLEETGDPPGTFCLNLGGRRAPLRRQ